jgi:hypothetical protein
MPSKTSATKSHKCKGKYAKRGTQAFWEARLKRAGLSMERGHDPHWLTYGHMVGDLDFDGRITYEPPQGERLDNGEWPISLM